MVGRAFSCPLLTPNIWVSVANYRLPIHPWKNVLSTDYQKLPETKDIKGSYSFISLGCPKNTVDSERMMGLLKIDGYQLINDPEQSDFVVVNTCGFIEQARKE